MKEHFQSRRRDPTRTLERVLAVLNKNEILLALDRIGHHRPNGVAGPTKRKLTQNKKSRPGVTPNGSFCDCRLPGSVTTGNERMVLMFRRQKEVTPEHVSYMRVGGSTWQPGTIEPSMASSFAFEASLLRQRGR